MRAIRGEASGVGTTPEQAIAITRFTQLALASAAAGREFRAGEVPLPRTAVAGRADGGPFRGWMHGTPERSIL